LKGSWRKIERKKRGRGKLSESIDIVYPLSIFSAPHLSSPLMGKGKKW
jgi:hypothetical protein